MIELKNSKFKIVILLFILIILFSASFIWRISDIVKISSESNTSFERFLSYERGNTYYRMNAGSAKKFLGNCLFINIFLSDEESCFNGEEKQAVMDKIKDMDTYFNEQIKKYNKDLNIIYNSNDLSIDYNTNFIISTDSDDWIWVHDVISNIYSAYDINGILKKYDAENLGFIINVNKSGVSYASMRSFDGILSDNEFAVLFNDGATAYTYAHEVLHLFGAIDLYNLDDKRLPLAQEYFPYEIMLCSSNNISEAAISNLTAYIIGWDSRLEKRNGVFLEKYKIQIE